VDLNRFLRAKEHFLENEERCFALLRDALGNIFGGIIKNIPQFEDDEQSLVVPLYSVIPHFGETVAAITSVIMDDTLCDAGLFTSLQRRLYDNACAASGIHDPNSRRPLITADNSELAPAELLEAYFAATPFYEFFLTPVPFLIPLQTRFSHQWIIGQPGTGKSTLLQHLIVQDLQKVADGEASIVVMESNRDLIKAIEGLSVFAPGELLDGKLLSIDLEDVEWPLALNLFDIGFSEIEKFEPRARVALTNTVLALYDYIFGSLFSAEMTSRQNTLFTFTIQLLLKIPGATLDTLIDLMQPKGLDNFRQYLPALGHDARRFFELKFNSTELNRTKSEVLDRLFAVKRNETLSNMFASPKSKLDFFDEMGKPQVILINAPQSLLQDDGVEIVGRFFIAMLLVAAQKRQVLPRQQRFPCFVYIDECQDFIRRDTKIPVILDQARKLNIGLILAHQRLNQMQPYVLDALYGSTAIKFAAQISDAGAHALARDMRTSSEFILNQPQYHFAAYVRGLTQSAVSVGIPHTDLSRAPRMTAADSAAIRASMRAKYAVPISELFTPPQAPESSPTPATVMSAPDSDEFADKY
ncbi:MAG: hypothetical protein K8F62_07550, partial [Pseudorhodoplanes sp.]|nr:hypothetical protein [Pseudorhodoplanes sp.]